MLDLIIIGNIITVVNQKPPAEAIGIKGGKIASVGPIKEVEKSAGKTTKVLDLTGKTILPGFIDTHTHILATGRNMLGIDFSSVNSVNEVLIKINQRAKTIPPGKLILGCKFNRLRVREKRFPYIDELDTVSSGHAVAIQHYDTHFFMLNSPAMKLFGLDENMDGVVKGKNGKPTGVIEDPISTDTWYKVVSMADDNERLEALKAVCQAFLKVGITTAHTKENLQDVNLITKNQECVPVRIKPLFFFSPLTAENIDEVIGTGILSGKNCVATYADGSIEGHTAAMYEPYADDKTALGMLYYTDEEMYAFVEKAHNAGFQISIHAESDRSIDQVLRAYEKVLEKYPSKDHRHRIEHFEVATPKQIKKVAASGIALAMQPMFITVCEGPHLDYYRSLLGEERVKRAHTYRAILNEEILVAGGSDSPVTKMNPIGGIHALVNHPIKEQRIDLNDAIEIFTINGAKIGFEEELKGSIEPRKLADFVVLSDDPYRVPRENINDIKVDMTIIDGNIVYERKGR